MSEAKTYNISLIDEYLESWDRFANGESNLVPYLRENKRAFEENLEAALKAKDKRAPARLVFYPIVQVGGYIEVESELGRAAASYLGAQFPVSENKDQKKVYFAGDLYLWWENNKERFDPLPLFERWKQREFSQKTVIPMYKAAVKKR